MVLSVLPETEIGELVQEDRVHRRVYADPAIFELEMERIWSRVWVYVGHESEVPNAGDYKTWTIARQPVILTRHRDGKLHILFNRCVHRGATVCQGFSGTSNFFRCAYHGWTYHNDGRLLGVPHRDAYPRDFKFPEGLAHVPRVESYRGFVFASLNPDVMSLVDDLGPMTECMDAVLEAAPDGEIEVRAGVHKYLYKGNWKFQIENVVDAYHPPFSHESDVSRPALNVGASPDARMPRPEEDRPARADTNESHAFRHGQSYFGGLITADRRSGPVIDSYFAALEKRRGKAWVEVYKRGHRTFGNQAYYPSVVIQGTTHIRCVIPKAVDLTEVRVYPIGLKGAPREMNQGVIRFLNLTHAAASLQQTDDQEMFWRNQKGLQALQPEWLLLARGIQREVDGPHPGERIGRATDETPFRAQFRFWKELMTAERWP